MPAMSVMLFYQQSRGRGSSGETTTAAHLLQSHRPPGRRFAGSAWRKLTQYLEGKSSAMPFVLGMSACGHWRCTRRQRVRVPRNTRAHGGVAKQPPTRGVSVMIGSACDVLVVDSGAGAC